MPGYASARMSPGDVGEVTVLKKQPKSDEALMLLKKIHSLVKPIMKKHGWSLPTLSEFFPKQTNLLGININRGQKICIRLRPAHDPNSFLDLESSLIGTMLHELTHNVRGPHDQIFYKQLDELQDEYDALRNSGYSGEGFLGDGNRVGLGVGHDNLTIEQARQKALKKFEERDKLQRLLGKGGRLGGTAPDMKGKRIGDILAEAAERRLRDAKTCGGGEDHAHTSGSKRENLPPDVLRAVEESERESRSEVIDLTADDGDNSSLTASGSGSAKSSSSKNQGSTSSPVYESSDSDIEVVVPARRAATSPPLPSSSSTSKPNVVTKKPRPLTPAIAWSCPVCTFDNVSPLSLACEVCYTERPSGVTTTLAQGVSQGRPKQSNATLELEDGWICHNCTSMTQHLFWTCSTCGTVKRSSTKS